MPKSRSKLNSKVVEKRAEFRRPITRTATLEINDQKIDCYVVDISPKGARVRILEPIEYGDTAVTLHLAGVGDFTATVRWTRGKEIGLLLDREIEAAERIRNTSIAAALRLIEE